MDLLTERRIAAVLLIACGLVFLPGGILYTQRGIWKWPTAQTVTHLAWERGFVIAAALINLMGFVLLEGLLRHSGDTILAPLALTVYLIGTSVLVAAESSFLGNREWVWTQVILYVIVAFLAQAAFGVALLYTGLVPAWASWTTIVWNLGWMAAFTIIHPHDIYYPVLHHVPPLIIGIALLASR